jgi:cobalt-zinc-cadmium efflux system protein
MVAPARSAHSLIFWVIAVFGRCGVSDAPMTATVRGRKKVSRSMGFGSTGRPVRSRFGPLVSDIRVRLGASVARRPAPSSKNDVMGSGHAVPSSHPERRRALLLALVVNAALAVAEVAGGLAFDSLALLADAAHVLSDVGALAVALIALRLVSRPATVRHSYGLQRAEVLGAQFNALVLLAGAAWITIEAVRRLDDPADVSGAGLLTVAIVGLAANVFSAALVGHSAGESVGMRGAFLHLVWDAVASVAAVGAGIAVVVWDADWFDPAASLAVAALVVWSAWTLLRDANHVLLEGTPRGMDPAAVEAALRDDAQVEEVHHLHLWNLASDVPALSVHLVLGGELTLHDAQDAGARLKAVLAERFGIEHATLELECHACD